MFCLTCSLHFPDGQSVAAQVTAASDIDDGPVSYSGPVERLPLTPSRANAIELRAYFASFARELGARFSEDRQDDRAVLTAEIDELLEKLKGLSAQRRKKPPTQRRRPR